MRIPFNQEKDIDYHIPGFRILCRDRKEMKEKGYHTSPLHGISDPDRIRSIVLSGAYADDIKGNKIYYIGQGKRQNQEDASVSARVNNNTKLFKHMKDIFSIWVLTGQEDMKYGLYGMGRLIGHEYKYIQNEGRICNVFIFEVSRLQ